MNKKIYTQIAKLCCFTMLISFANISFAQTIVHPVIVEEATGTWCGFCPRGAVYMDSMSNKYGKDFIGIAVHNGTNDPMVVDAYDKGVTNFPSFSGFPSAIVARLHLVSPEDIETPFLTEAATPVTVDLSAIATYDKVSRELVVKISSTTTKNYVAPKFFIALVEDGIKGLAAGYAQANYYSGGGNGVMGGFEKLANPVPANQMVYNHVARALFGGYNGLSGSIKSPWFANTTVTYDHTGYIIPDGFNIANCHVVVGVMDNQSKFLNATKVDLQEATASKELNADTKVIISPNPARNVAYLQIDNTKGENTKLSIFNAFGIEVANQDLGNFSGLTSVPVSIENLASGNYFVKVTMGSKTYVKQLMVLN